MGAGLFKAGETLAGFDTPSASSQLSPLSNAPAYDPRLRVIPILSDGSNQQVHWVDQEVALRLTNALGTFKHAPDVGIDRERLKLATTENVQTVVEDCVNLALEPLLTKKAIRIDRIDVFFRPSGSLAFTVHYANLLASQQPTRPFTVG